MKKIKLNGTINLVNIKEMYKNKETLFIFYVVGRVGDLCG